jgi:hypothetical protein
LRVDETTSATGGRPGRPVEVRHVPAGGISVYATADASDAPIAELPAGFELTVAGRRGPWVHVVSGDGLDGWVGGSELAGIAMGASPVVEPVPTAATESVVIAPMPVAVVEKQPSSLLIGTGPVLGAIGGIIAIIGAAVPWQQTIANRVEVDAFDISVRFLGSSDQITARGFSIGLLILILAGIGAVVTMFSGGGIVRRVLGGAVVLVCIVYVLQQQDWLISNERGLGTGLNVWDVADYGVLVSFAGGMMMVLAPSR